MISKSIQKIAGVSLGNIANALLGFLFLAVAAKILPIEEFGQYAMLTSILLVSSKVVDFGSNSIYVANSISAKKNTGLTDTFHSFKFIMFLVTLLPMCLAVTLFSHTDIRFLLLSAGGLVAYTFNLTLFAHFQKDERYVPLIFLNTLPSVIKLLFAGLIFFGVVAGSLFNFYAVFSLSIGFCVLLLPFVSKTDRSFNYSLVGVRELLTTGTPQGVSQIMQETWPALNNIITKVIYGFSDVGVFSMANKISNVFTLLSLSIFTVLLPQNAKKKRNNLKYDIGETVLISAGILVLSGVAIIFAKAFLTLFFEEKFTKSFAILEVLIFSSALTAISSFIENYFIVQGITRYILFVSTVKIFLFIIATVLLTETSGLLGLAYANLISTLGALTITGYYVKKSFTD